MALPADPIISGVVDEEIYDANASVTITFNEDIESGEFTSGDVSVTGDGSIVPGSFDDTAS